MKKDRYEAYYDRVEQFDMTVSELDDAIKAEKERLESMSDEEYEKELNDKAS